MNQTHHHNDGADQEEQLELPPGFRFHPTDEELITHYLNNKILNPNFNPIAIGHADLNKSEPWDLPGRAKMGENEWYFFCVKDRKYPTGLRTNRATESGYWKATGKDKEIFKGKRIVGMKKTLVFYTGRAPKGEKSNWVMHEYRLQSKFHLPSHLFIKSTKNEWVICRIFNKSTGENKRTHISELLTRISPALPPLMEYSGEARAPHVSCFSNETKPYTNADLLYNFKTHNFSSSSTSMINVPPPSDWMAGNSMVRMLLENQTAESELMNPKVEISPYDQGFRMMVEDNNHDDPIDLESLWNY